MSEEIYCIEVPKELTQKTIDIIRSEAVGKLSIDLHNKYKISDITGMNKISIPLKIAPDLMIDKPRLLENLHKLLENNHIKNFKVTKNLMTKKHLIYQKPRNLREALEDNFPEEIIPYVSLSYDIIGSILIMEIDRWGDLDSILVRYDETRNMTVETFKKKIGDIALELHNNIRTVYNKKSEVKGEFRIREYELIAGMDNPITLHKENGCKFELNIEKMFFTPRLVTERKRVSKLDYGENSIVLDCFAGVGPFSIQICANNNVTIYSCEKNPEAIQYLKNNIQLNKKKLKGEIYPYLGDFHNFKDSEQGKSIYGNVDTIIMNLPERNLEFIKDIRPFIKKNGTILIIYLFCEDPEPIPRGISQLENFLAAKDLRVSQIRNKQNVKNYSPNVSLIGLDLLLKIR
ncbi:MAG: hypothetical protein GF364_20710 [Candidatus Lokiarchaeota archaeon]|nr:hypothetical protein [Candidatus Lokiarchaeota archaeon]